MTTDKALGVIVWGMIVVSFLNLLDALITIIFIHKVGGYTEINGLVEPLVTRSPLLFVLLKAGLSVLLLVAARMNYNRWDDYKESKGMVAATVFMVFVGAGAYIYYTIWNLLQVIL